ncbi:MAG: zinc-dependent metalloprotease [Chitinophagales bacterium]|nr:zinc-dependent metalloprotease [Chitinophagales bacterium]
MKKVFTIIISGTMLFANAQQHFCGTSEKNLKAIEADPSILKIEKDLNNFTQQFANQPNASAAGRNCPITIPIVFHILHNFGKENISDAQVEDQVRILNEDYNKLNSDTSIVVNAFKNNIANIGIQFRLARIDPNGNPTNGIVRIPAQQTYNGTDNAKIGAWPREKYLNVWVAHTMEDGVAGYAYLPPSVAGIMTDKDGIMILHQYIGSIGTGNAFRSRALTHEIGHYLNLEHPWGRTNQPGEACGDDGVFDTPITRGSTSCNLNLNDCEVGVIENVQNFMDYSYCSVMFTEGQKTRMLAALNSTISSRNNLWSCQNLTETGTADPYNDYAISKPIASFGTQRLYTCVGNSVKFIDASYNALVEDRMWEFTNADISTSTDSVVTVSFNATGWQTVKLTVGNGFGTSTAVDSFAIYVSEGNVFHSAPFFEDFERPESFEEWTSINYNATPSYFQPTTVAARSGNHSYMVNNYKKTRQSDVEEIISPTMDLTGLQNMTFSFYYSLASADQSYANNGIDSISVFASTNCGEQWLKQFKMGGPDIVNSGYLLSNFQPSAGFYWKKVTFNMSANTKKSNVIFKIQYKSSALSNNFYIDDINIGGVIVNGIEDAAFDNGALKVFPNPSNGTASISFAATQNEAATIEIFDVSGKSVATVFEGNISAGESRFDINKNIFPATGVYLVKVKTASKVLSTRAVITQ